MRPDASHRAHGESPLLVLPVAGVSGILRAVSEGNAEIVRRGLDAFNRGDWEAVFEHFAADFELDNSRDLGEWRGVHRTPDEVRRMWATFTATWESWRTEVDEIIEAGEHLVTRQTIYLRGRDGSSSPRATTTSGRSATGP